MPTFRPAYPHGSFEEVFPNLFFLRGRLRLAPGVTITRNMVVVRVGNDLVLVNSVRLTAEGEAELAKLGQVKHLVRLGFAHGADDAYYVHRYRPTFWAPRGQRHARGVAPDYELGDGQSPLERSSVFPFQSGSAPEAVLLLERPEGGVIVPCDSYQNWTTFEGCSALGTAVLRGMGFGPSLIGGPWARRMGSRVKKDFDALVERNFVHLLPAHGEPLKGTAREALRAAMARRFASG
ncbi:MAG TPA: hypothetical protein VFZ53_30000 [Polyangiaceae bacterium]